MKRSRRVSPQTASVVVALAAEPQARRYGYDLCQETGLKAGTMYPILIRLVDQGLLETNWEETHAPGRPPRHLYRLTASGLALARDLARAAVPATEAKPSRPHLGLEGAK
jgi:PadR family transcriptional regulator, regulatory protein PadR